jgi:hypothetical protein
MGIRDRPASPRSPWQNGFVERLIGSIRRECLDHVVVFGERHLRRVLLSYINYYNETRARTYPWIRIRPYRVLSRGQGVLFAAQSSADCITNMSGCDLRQAQGAIHAEASKLTARLLVLGHFLGKQRQ